MNTTINHQAKSVKKLAISKETIRQLTTNVHMAYTRRSLTCTNTEDCTLTCTSCYNCQ
jgi:hypothetical protein